MTPSGGRQPVLVDFKNVRYTLSQPYAKGKEGGKEAKRDYKNLIADVIKAHI